MMAIAVAVLASALTIVQADAPSLAEPVPTPSLNGGPNFCRVLDALAVQNDLPMPFFARLIWQESKFDPHAQSSAGAQGVAQFMPFTAASRGLLDPFEPTAALRESASYLRELRNTFGNLGLAAAAYNAGPYRVSQWLAHKASLPDETIAYVQIVTGHSVSDWAGPDAAQWEASLPLDAGCDDVRQMLTLPPAGPSGPPSAPWKPWGVQLAGAWTRGPVLAAFERLRRRFADILEDRPPLILRVRPAFAPALHYVVRIGEDSAAAANRLCGRLRAAGGVCDVVRNPR
ncbi:MAG TPA: lytic transglycosylase domain-containing protein [Roseiarcus sp.]|nr:lytic transglycosylase domain-containing protein [Roseiarcus sp.]